jgi:hypothetical protein
MKLRHSLIGLLALCGALATPAIWADGTEKCSWVRSGAILGQPWDTEQGLCKVTVTGSHFEAVLYDEKNVDWARFKIAGSINGDKLAVKVETENSDAGLDDFTGKLKTSAWHEKVIILSDGYNMIGIKLDSN